VGLLLALRKQLMKRQPRVFLGVLDIGGYYGALTYGLRELGVDAHMLDLGNNAYNYNRSVKHHPLAKAYKWFNRKFGSSRTLSRLNPLRYFWTALSLGSLTLLISWICIRFDIIVLKSGIGFTSSCLDLRLFKSLKKKLVFIYHGSDSRPPYLNAYWDEHMTGSQLVEWTRQIKNHVDRVSHFADYIVDNPLSAHFQTRTVCTFQCLGNLVEMEKVRTVSEFHRSRPSLDPIPCKIRILHAPSLRGIKGSDRIHEVIKKLKEMGYRIEYVEISGKPNATVMQEIAESDIIVDELYSDTHGAMFSMEAAALGKPSFVGGFGWEILDKFVPPEARFPTLYKRPDELEGTLIRLIEDVEFRLECGRKAREFAEGWAKPTAVASRLLMVARGEAPSSWFFEPNDIRYTCGLGAKPDRMARVIRKLFESGGTKALLLDDKPELFDEILIFAQQNAGQAQTGTKD